MSDETPDPGEERTEPFSLLTKTATRPPTLAEVSGQITALSQQFTVFGHAQAQLRGGFVNFAQRVEARFDAFHEELALLRHATLGEGGIQQRVTQVEQRTLWAKTFAGAVGSIKWISIATGLLTFAGEIVATRYPHMAGPFKHLVEVFSKATAP